MLGGPSPCLDSLVSPLECLALEKVLLAISTAHPNEVSQPTDSASDVSPRVDVEISDACISANPSDEYVVCLDFGTAKSKAFACKASQYRDDDLSASDLLDLGIGVLDKDPDSAYTIESTVWISDEGRLYVGSQAMRLGKEWSSKGRRSRLDSIKQYLTLGQMNEKSNEILPAEINPTGEILTYGEAACFFMAYLNDVTGQALSQLGRDRYNPPALHCPRVGFCEAA